MGYINNIQVDSTTHLIEPTLYAASSTSNSGAAYTASISDFSLVTGVTIQIKFSVTNKANATLSINNGDVKNIYYNNAKVTANLFKANHIYELTYDGTQWQVVGDINTDTWKALSTSQAGYVAQAPNDTTKFLRGDANWAVLPAASTTVAGITKVGASDGAAAYSHNHNGTYVPMSGGTNDLNTIYDTSIKNITGGSMTNGPTSYGYGEVITFSYRKHTGNTTPDYATQLYAHYNANTTGNCLYFRTSSASAWNTWQMVAHSDAGTAVGNSTTPVYITNKGDITAGTALGESAYHADSYFSLASHTHNASDINAGTLSTDRLPDDVVKKRTGLTSSTTEDNLVALIPGMYDHTSSGVDNALPTGYGTVLNIAGSYYYGALIAAETNNSLYYRAYYYENDNSKLWRGNWQMVAHADYGTAVGNATTPIYISNTGVITSGTAIGASAYHADSYFALASHGNHVPTTQTANNITFLRNDNSWYKLTKTEVNTLINLLDTGSSDLTTNDYVITQYVGGGTTTTTYHRRPASKVVNATLVKAALGTNNTHDNTFLRKDGTWQTPPYPVTSVATLTGAITASDLVSQLGLSNALHFIGITSTTLADGSTTATLTPKTASPSSLNKTTGFVDGDVVMDEDQLREYVWSGSAWRLLGITTSTAYSQTTTGNSWIASITQDTDGKITATTGTLNTSGDWTGTAAKATKANITSTKWGISYYSDTAGTFNSTGAGAAGNVFIGSGNAAPAWYAGLSLTGAGTQQSPYNANFSNTVTITGASTLSSTLSVASTSTLTGNVTIGDNSHASTLTVFGATTLKNTASIIGNTTIGNSSTASTLEVYGATTLNNTLSVTSTSTLTGKVGIGAAPDNTYQLYVEGNSQFKGNIIPQATNTYYLGSNGNSPLRWKGLYIGTADSYGDAYTPVYWNNGVPDTVSPVQYFTWTISNGKSGVTLTNSNIFTTNTYNVILVVTSGETNLNAPLVWSSADGTFSIQSKSGNTAVATSGDVSGYAIVARGTNITSSLSSTDIT